MHTLASVCIMTNYVVVTSLRRDERRVEVFVTPLSLTGIHKCLTDTKEEIRKYLKNR